MTTQPLAAWRRPTRRLFPLPGVRSWAAAAVVLAFAGTLSQAFR